MSADLIIKNGKLYSVALDGTETRAEAIAVEDGRISFIGTSDEALKLAGADTNIIDAQGCSIIPGLGDSHLHASWSASSLFSANLFGTDGATPKETIENIKQKMIEYMKDHPDDKIVRGAGWNSAILTSEQYPTRFDLDEICPDRPMVLESYCQHFNWINTKAMEMAGIDESTPTPKTASIPRDSQGMPLGIFGEFAGIQLVRNRLKLDYSIEEYRKTLEIYQRDLANSYGVTMIYDAYCSDVGREAYKEMARDGSLTIRVKGGYYADPSGDKSQFDEIIARKKSGVDDIGNMFRIDTVKFFLEGSGLGFYMLDGFAPEFRQALGLPENMDFNLFWDTEEFKKTVARLNAEGLQIHTHAMGDGSVKQAVDAFEYSNQQGAGDVRNVIAHLMAVRPEDIERMGRNKVVASVQPTWMTQEPISTPSLIQMMGLDRYLNFYPFKRLIDAGCVTAAGTDYPVTPPPDPFISLEHGMTRSMYHGCTYAGDGSYYKLTLGPTDNPTQDCVSLKEALTSLTIGVAYECFLENETGSLEVGKSAEIVVLDKDLEAIPVTEIHNLKVKKTVFRGNVVYEA